jgi:hypothetical protein
MADAMFREMLAITEAIVPRPDRYEVKSRKIRPVCKDGSQRRTG